MSKTFASFAFGCRVNEAEKVALDRNLINLGFEYNQDQPDFFIINSCAVTQKAEREVRQLIYQTRKKFPRTKIILTGCAATLWQKNNHKMNEVDLLVENSHKINIPGLIKNLKPSPINSYQRINMLIREPDKFLNSGRLMVKIQDGCNRFCSYCIVPYLRGKPTSRTITEIIGEIKAYGNNVKEVILSAINTEYFGFNTGETLPQLLDSILQETEVPRISFGSINPWSVDNNFIKWYKNNANNHRFVHFFHIPVQSGSDRILKLMNRGYTVSELKSMFNALYLIDSNALFGTDVIVGFPGETEFDFQQSYNFLKDSPFVKLHVFHYSPRPNTLAALREKAWGKVSARDKTERAGLLRKLHEAKTRQFTEKLIGKTGTALFLKTGPGLFRDAIFENQMTLSVKVKSTIEPGEIRNVRIVGYESKSATAATNI